MPSGVYQRTEEMKKKMSTSHLGKTLSSNHRENISRSLTGRILSEEHIKNLSLANRGKKRSKETIRKMSEARIGKPSNRLGAILSEETREKIRLARTRQIFSEETRKKLSTSLMGNKNSLGHIASKETRRKLSESLLGNKRMLGHTLSKETREKISKKMKGRIISGQWREKLIQVLASNRRKRPKRIEMILLKMKQEEFPEEIIVREHQVNSYFIDVAIPSLMLAFEADGTYWHNRSDVKENDAKRQLFLESKGWNVQRYSQNFLNKYAEERKWI